MLRAHIALAIPEYGRSGVTVEGETRYHRQGDVLVFDDSKLHLGFNHCSAHRCVLIVDFARPEHLPPGRATGGQTEALKAFIDYFARGGDAHLALPPPGPQGEPADLTSSAADYGTDSDSDASDR